MAFGSSDSLSMLMSNFWKMKDARRQADRDQLAEDQFAFTQKRHADDQAYRTETLADAQANIDLRNLENSRNQEVHEADQNLKAHERAGLLYNDVKYDVMQNFRASNNNANGGVNESVNWNAAFTDPTVRDRMNRVISTDPRFLNALKGRNPNVEGIVGFQQQEYDSGDGLSDSRSVLMLKMKDGSTKPMSARGGTDDEVVALSPKEVFDFADGIYVKSAKIEDQNSAMQRVAMDTYGGSQEALGQTTQETQGTNTQTTTGTTTDTTTDTTTGTTTDTSSDIATADIADPATKVDPRLSNPQIVMDKTSAFPEADKVILVNASRVADELEKNPRFKGTDEYQAIINQVGNATQSWFDSPEKAKAYARHMMSQVFEAPQPTVDIETVKTEKRVTKTEAQAVAGEAQKEEVAATTENVESAKQNVKSAVKKGEERDIGTAYQRALDMQLLKRQGIEFTSEEQHRYIATASMSAPTVRKMTNFNIKEIEGQQVLIRGYSDGSFTMKDLGAKVSDATSHEDRQKAVDSRMDDLFLYAYGNSGYEETNAKNGLNRGRFNSDNERLAYGREFTKQNWHLISSQFGLPKEYTDMTNGDYIKLNSIMTEAWAQADRSGRGKDAQTQFTSGYFSEVANGLASKSKSDWLAAGTKGAPQYVHIPAEVKKWKASGKYKGYSDTQIRASVIAALQHKYDLNNAVQENK